MGRLSSKVIGSGGSIEQLAEQGAVVDLRQEGLVADSAAGGSNNVDLLNTLAVEARTAGRPLVMRLPSSTTIYLDKAGSNWSFLIDDCADGVALVGDGTTRLIQHGTGTGNDWSGIFITGNSNAYLHGFTLYQGEIGIPSTGQHDHLITVQNLDGGVPRVRGSDLKLGKCLGDCIAFIGESSPVRDCMFTGLDIDAAGIVLRPWAPSTAYVFGQQVYNGTTCYYCTTAGTSAALPSTGPSTTGAGITDGTVVWSSVVGGATYRTGARTGISFQRGYQNIRITNFNIRGQQNSGIDMEASGSGTLNSAGFGNGYVDGSAVNGSRTATGFSYSGSGSQTDPTLYSWISNVTLYNCCLQISETVGSSIDGLKIVQDTPPLSEAQYSTPLLYTLRNNEGLRLNNISLHRTGTAADGDLVDFQHTGMVTMGGNWTAVNDTNGQFITSTSPFQTAGSFNYKMNGDSPSLLSAVTVTALGRDCDDLKLDGINVECTTGTLKAHTIISTRVNESTGRSIDDISLTRLSAKEGSVGIGVLFSKEPGSTMDPSPILQGCDFPGATVYRVENDADSQVHDQVFPIIAGNDGGACTYTGTIDPTGFVRASQGSTYVRQNGDSSELYFKTTGTGRGGWALVEVGTPEPAALDLPTDAASWVVHIADNGLTTPAPTRAWTCQVGSGNLTPSIGALSLTAAGSPTYSNDESSLGYTDVSVGLDDDSADAFSTADASMPNPSTTSMMMVVVGRLTGVPSGSRSWIQMSESNQVRIVNSGGNARARHFLGGNDVTPAYDIDTNVHIWVLRVNETANTVLFANEAIKSEPGYSSVTATKLFGIGHADLNAPGFNCLRIYEWDGADAEMSNAEVRDLIESFGEGVAWTP